MIRTFTVPSPLVPYFFQVLNQRVPGKLTIRIFGEAAANDNTGLTAANNDEVVTPLQELGVLDFGPLDDLIANERESRRERAYRQETDAPPSQGRHYEKTNDCCASVSV
jgi:hypothetical protein